MDCSADNSSFCFQILGGENISDLLNSSRGNGTNIKTTQGNDIKEIIYSILIPVVLSFCFVSFILSMVVVGSTPFVKRPMSATIRLTISLSVANAAFAAVVFIASIIQSYLPYVFGLQVPVCYLLILEAFRLGIILVQVFHLVAVALVHYTGTIRPLYYASKITPGVLKAIIAILWILPVSGIFIGFASIPEQGFQSEGCQNNHFRLHGVTFRYIWTGIFFGPTVLLIAIYAHIFLILRRRGKNLFNSEQRKNFQRSKKTVKTTALIVGTFLFGWCPAVLSFVLICKECPIQVDDLTTSIAIFSTAYILFILKVFIDTFIYAIRLPEIRDALRIMRRRASMAICCRKQNMAQSVTHYYTQSGKSSFTRSTHMSLTEKSLFGANNSRKKSTVALLDMNTQNHENNPSNNILHSERGTLITQTTSFAVS